MRAVTTCDEVTVETVDGPFRPIPYGQEKTYWGEPAVTTAGLTRAASTIPAATSRSALAVADRF
jgi:hypothetical protein